ncbi:MAG: DUF4202 domain-containing protein [Gammaproteobacteria bacterium]|nr:DUF4202 domain-containing protein [Gammaproteobacteria bacterium]MCK5263638.1 DUF4202 domain-containing protein [Gammaproteobacteria bacterium]
MSQQAFETARDLINQANSEDPNTVVDAENKEWPKELLYSHHMSDMLERFTPDTDGAMKLAIQAQHIQRWKSPRSDYPMNRKGYHQWRTALYTFHAETLAALMEKAGYSEDSLERVKLAVGKKALKKNPDTQLVEDIAALVFIEHYMLAFANKHPEYDEAKWIDIIRKTWRKMSEPGQQFALSGSVQLPEPLVPLIQKALSND